MGLDASSGKVIISDGSGKTKKLGKKLGCLLEPGDVVALIGPLGAGKTVIAKGIAAGLGVVEEITSPSFNIALEYCGRIKLYHIDFYRLEKAGDAVDIGIDEYIYGDGVTVIEWADHLPGLMPPDHIEIRMDFGPKKNERVIRIIAHGSRMNEKAANV